MSLTRSYWSGSKELEISSDELQLLEECLRTVMFSYYQNGAIADIDRIEALIARFDSCAKN